MSIQFTSNPQQAFNRIFSSDVKAYAQTRTHAYCNKYTPARSTDLMQTVTFHDDYFEYTMPYAHYIWEGKLYLAPNGSSWAKKGETKQPSGKDLEYSTDVNPWATSHWEKAMARQDGQRLADDISDYIRKR